MERLAHGSGYRPLQGYRLGDARGSVRPSAVCNAVPGITHEGLLELPGTPGAWLARAHSPHPQSPVGLEVCAHPHTRAHTHARQARILPPRPARLSGRDDTRRLAGPGPEGRRRPRSQTAPARGEPSPVPGRGVIATAATLTPTRGPASRRRVFTCVRCSFPLAKGPTPPPSLRKSRRGPWRGVRPGQAGRDSGRTGKSLKRHLSVPVGHG